MSSEFLTTIDNTTPSKSTKSGDINFASKTTEKKEVSFFDSLMKDIKSDNNESNEIKKDSDKPSSTLDVKVKNATLVKIAQNTTNEKQDIKKNPVNKMVDKLVDMVVSGSKKEDKESETSLEDIESETKTTETKTIESKNTETKTIESKNAETKTIESKNTETKTIESKNTETKTMESKNTETKTIESKNTETKINDNKTIEIKTNKEENTESKNIKHLKVDVEDKSSDSKIVNIQESKDTTKEKIIETVSEKSKDIQESAQAIKETISKIEKNNVSKVDIEKSVEKETTKIDLAVKDIEITVDEVDTKSEDDKNIKIDLKEKVEEKTDQIKEAVKDIKIIVSQIDISNKEEYKLEVKQKVETKTNTINEVVKDIKIIVSTVSKDVIKNSEEKKVETKTTVGSTNIVDSKEILDKKIPIIANMFLNSQQKVKEKVSMEQVSQAKGNIEDKKSVQSVKESAQMLELGLDEAELQEKKIVNKNINVNNENQKLRNNGIGFTKNRELNKMLLDEKVNNSGKITDIADNNIEENTKVEKEIVVNVPRPVVETIQSKIIGAQQKVGNFMSDVAKNMYLNYKAPFTSFKMNLNPANLGSISIVMRANKSDNSISVSMNMSNNSTMETFSENRSSLQNALQKQLGDNSSVSLNFDMQGDNSNSTFEQFNENSRQKNSGINTSNINNDIEEQEEVIEIIDYM